MALTMASPSPAIPKHTLCLCQGSHQGSTTNPARPCPRAPPSKLLRQPYQFPLSHQTQLHLPLPTPAQPAAVFPMLNLTKCLIKLSSSSSSTSSSSSSSSVLSMRNGLPPSTVVVTVPAAQRPPPQPRPAAAMLSLKQGCCCGCLHHHQYCCAHPCLSLL